LRIREWIQGKGRWREVYWYSGRRDISCTSLKGSIINRVQSIDGVVWVGLRHEQIIGMVINNHAIIRRVIRCHGLMGGLRDDIVEALTRQGRSL
jgi:hypothetical protein